MDILLNLFPGGVNRALTMSYDDGQIHDIPLIEIFNKYGIKGTFHLNSDTLDKAGFLTSSHLKNELQQHEVSVHTKSHPYLNKLPASLVIDEILEDKKKLESITEKLMYGLSYPYGVYNPKILSIAQDCGMLYGRTVESTNGFDVPDDFMRWHPTTHHNGNLKELWDSFIDHSPSKMLLFYLWGHSYEFPNQNNWEVIEDFCRMASSYNEIWYATNAEIYHYVTAVRGLIFSGDKKIICNPSATEVWLTANNQKIALAPGETRTFY